LRYSRLDSLPFIRIQSSTGIEHHDRPVGPARRHTEMETVPADVDERVAHALREDARHL
jgi:hypothetical protein